MRSARDRNCAIINNKRPPHRPAFFSSPLLPEKKNCFLFRACESQFVSYNLSCGIKKKGGAFCTVGDLYVCKDVIATAQSNPSRLNFAPLNARARREIFFFFFLKSSLMCELQGLAGLLPQLGLVVPRRQGVVRL